MLAGVDADFLVAVEIADHPFHAAALHRRDTWLDGGGAFALVPQTLAEFIHVVTDPRRMPCPLSTKAAVQAANYWWNAAEVVQLQVGTEAMALFFDWMTQHRLGRKRILDTLLAATLAAADVPRLVTNNGSDYQVLDCLELMEFRDSG